MNSEIQRKYNVLKSALNLSDDQVALMFGYKGRVSFANSTRRQKVLEGMIQMAEAFGFSFDTGTTADRDVLNEIAGLEGKTLIGKSKVDGLDASQAYSLGAADGFNACAVIALEATGVVKIEEGGHEV